MLSFKKETEWKCKTCGKAAYHLYGGVGACCSPELQEQNRLAAQHEQERRDLLWALQSRVLTDEEMAKVAQRDYHLLVAPMVPFYEADVRRQFGDMLLLQFKLRLAQNLANKLEPKKECNCGRSDCGRD